MHADTVKFYKYKPVDKPNFSDRFCRLPFTSMQIDTDGDVQLCSCQHHMPYNIGNIYQNNLQDIWLSEIADKVRQSVVDGKFTYCSWDCSRLYNLPKKSNVTPTVQQFPVEIKIDLDKSCNLSCPSCREHVIIDKSSVRIQKQVEIYQEIKQWAINNPNFLFNISPCTSGEIFASHSGLKFLESLVDFPNKNLQLNITTNGTLLTKNKNLILALKNTITNISVSIDAATPETYSVVRGGDWNELLQGLNLVKQTVRIPINLKFVIQQANFQEIVQFAEFADQYNANIYFSSLLDWGHWTIDWWSKNSVVKQSSPDLKLILDNIRDLKLRYPKKIFVSADIIRLSQKANELSQ